MNEKEYAKEKLKAFTKKDIIFTYHVKIRMLQRQLTEEEVVENIINPKRLTIAIREETLHKGEEKFSCYFAYSKTQCHNYTLAIHKKIILITVIKINRRWQHIAEKKVRK